MSVDVSVSFSVILYGICIESLLFFAVIMQTKSVEPGAHSGIARYFGLMFLFQAFSALFTALAEQFYSGFFSYYFAIISVAMTVLAIAVTVPASVAVAIPERNRQPIYAMAYLFSILSIIITSLKLGPILTAGPDVPYVDGTLQREVLVALASSMSVLALASLVRMFRRKKGRNGAFILLAALALVLIFGGVWSYLEPLCRIVDTSNSSITTRNVMSLHSSIQRSSKALQYPESCPLPQSFDHNFLIGLVILAANVLAAEGVLRLMAAGSGVEGYVDIIPVIPT